MNIKILQFIGKGQITIPQAWRAVLGLEQEALKATLEGDKIILQPFLLKEEKMWDIEMISINSLSSNDQQIIREGRTAYKKGKKEKFLSAPDFFKSQQNF